MRLLTKSILLSALAALTGSSLAVDIESHTSLRHDDHDDHNDHNKDSDHHPQRNHPQRQRQLQSLAKCTNPQTSPAISTYLGCYTDKNNARALPLEPFGPESRGKSAFECEAECASRGHTLFAREFKGQCFCGDGGVDEYDVHGAASGCDCCGENVGSNIMCVWLIGENAPGCAGSGTDHSTYLGCYRDRNNHRALPVKMDGRKHTAIECEEACTSQGYSYFAREWRGQCFCGGADVEYSKHGVGSGCDCCGDDVGSNLMCVWKDDA